MNKQKQKQKNKKTRMLKQYRSFYLGEQTI